MFALRIFAALVALHSIPALADDSGLTVINLHHRDASSLIPMLRSMYGNQLIINGMGMKIFIKGPDTLSTEAGQVAQSLDGKPRMLRVAIRSPGQSKSEATSIAVNGKAKLGPAAVTVTNRSPAAGGGLMISNNNPAAGAAVQANQTSVTQNTTADRYVIVEEGVPATITDASGNQMVVRVLGDTTTVQMASSPTGSNASGMATTVTGANGQWIPIGGISQSAQSDSSGILNHSSGTAQSGSQTSIQVTPVSADN